GAGLTGVPGGERDSARGRRRIGEREHAQAIGAAGSAQDQRRGRLCERQLTGALPTVGSQTRDELGRAFEGGALARTLAKERVDGAVPVGAGVRASGGAGLALGPRLRRALRRRRRCGALKSRDREWRAAAGTALFLGHEP